MKEVILVIRQTLPETIVWHRGGLLKPSSFTRSAVAPSSEVENAMLAEKYILLLETLRSQAERSPAHADGAPKVISTSAHVPAQLPGAGRK